MIISLTLMQMINWFALVELKIVRGDLTDTFTVRIEIIFHKIENIFYNIKIVNFSYFISFAIL
jgi:hypothetical protein